MSDLLLETQQFHLSPWSSVLDKFDICFFFDIPNLFSIYNFISIRKNTPGIFGGGNFGNLRWRQMTMKPSPCAGPWFVPCRKSWDTFRVFPTVWDSFSHVSKKLSSSWRWNHCWNDPIWRSYFSNVFKWVETTNWPSIFIHLYAVAHGGHEGLLIGGSCGSTVAGAYRFIKENNIGKADLPICPTSWCIRKNKNIH